MTNPSRTLVRRGGSWFSFTVICRPTYRSSRGDAKQSSRQLGFRVVCLPREVSPPRIAVRGGTWLDDSAWGCRSVYRDWWEPTVTASTVGFRVVCLPREVTPPRMLVRGGSFHNFPHYCRAVSRLCYFPTYAYAFIGFRVVCLPKGVTP